MSSRVSGQGLYTTPTFDERLRVYVNSNIKEQTSPHKQRANFLPEPITWVASGVVFRSENKTQIYTIMT